MTNRLATAKSLYLRKHAENPIDWYSWSDEAIETARRQNKPIFLSIGYSSCHWCTVMEGEAFSNDAIAQYMNANFLPIKVDREERPDLDSIYMQSLQLMTGQGGWPLNVFLTPDDLVPFYGGTYFPVEPRYGRPGFLQLLQAIRRYYDGEKGKLQAFKEEILEYLHQGAAVAKAEELGATKDLLWRGLNVNTGIIARQTPGQSFPMIPYAQLVLQGSRFNFESDLKQASTQRGLNLAQGGIYDHVGGGFHRYTVDPTWTVPHFEKMLYDNGQIVEYLAQLWADGVKEPAFDRAIALTVQWLEREMTAPSGYFYAAQDADSFATPEAVEPEEGHFYVWTHTELQAILTPEELKALQEEFTVTPEGNFENSNVLQRRSNGSLSPTTEAALAKMFQVRYGIELEGGAVFPPARNNQEAKTNKWPGRIPPVTDTKAIVAWNALMISGLAKAASVFSRPSYLKLAVRAADFILENQWVDGRMHRLNYDGVPAVPGQAEDYALLIKALLDLHQASLSFLHNPSDALENSPPSKWLAQAVKVQTEFDQYLWSDELGGYFNNALDSSSTVGGLPLMVRERSYTDSAIPAPNGVAATNLMRLALLTENLEYLDRASATLQAFRGVMEASPTACPTLFSALDWYQHCTLIRTTPDLLASLSGRYLPTAVGQKADELPPDAVGLVCEGLSCKEPATTVEQLLEQVLNSQTRAGFVVGL